MQLFKKCQVYFELLYITEGIDKLCQMKKATFVDIYSGCLSLEINHDWWPLHRSAARHTIFVPRAWQTNIINFPSTVTRGYIYGLSVWHLTFLILWSQGHSSLTLIYLYSYEMNFAMVIGINSYPQVEMSCMVEWRSQNYDLRDDEVVAL